MCLDAKQVQNGLRGSKDQPKGFQALFVEAPSWKQGLQDAGYMLGGHRALFEGIGAVFSTMDVARNANTAVSFVSNDNHQSLAYGVDVPTSNAKVAGQRWASFWRGV